MARLARAFFMPAASGLFLLEAHMPLSLLLEAVQSYEDNSGRPLSGGLLYTYDAGTLNPKATYKDLAGTIPNTNPIVLDARGEATVYGDGNYRMVLKDALEATIWDRDNVSASGTAGADAALALLGVDTGANQGPTYIGFDGGTLADFIRTKNARIVNTIADLRALDSTLYNNAAIIGYYAKGDGVTGAYYVDTADTTSTDNGGTVIVGADNARWKLVWPGNEISVDQFGAKGDGTTNDATSIQAAITAVQNAAGSGTVWLNQKVYGISTPLVANKAILLRGQVRYDLASNTNGSTNARPIVKWIGETNANIRMFTIKPAAAGDCVWGGGALDIEWDGQVKAGGGVHFDNTKYARLRGKCRNVLYAGAIIDSMSGTTGNFSMKNFVEHWEFVWGVADACKPAHGLVLGGNGAGVPATQQHIGPVHGLVYNGAAVYVAETDNAQLQSVLASVQAGGTGCAVRLAAAGAQPANHTQIGYIAGPVIQDAGVIGTRFLSNVSEGGGFTQNGGSSNWSGEIVDYGTGRLYKSHFYRMRKWLDLRPGDFVADGTVASADTGLVWRTLSFPNSGSPKAAVMIPADYDLANGVLIGLDLFYATNGTAGGNFKVSFKLSTAPTYTAGPVVTPEHVFEPAIPQAAQYQIAKYSYTIAPPVSFTQGDVILLSIQRLAGDAQDTSTDDMQLIGVRLNYQSSGPTTPGSGTYYVPAWD